MASTAGKTFTWLNRTRRNGSPVKKKNSEKLTNPGYDSKATLFNEGSTYHYWGHYWKYQTSGPRIPDRIGILKCFLFVCLSI